MRGCGAEGRCWPLGGAGLAVRVSVRWVTIPRAGLRAWRAGPGGGARHEVGAAPVERPPIYALNTEVPRAGRFEAGEEVFARLTLDGCLTPSEAFEARAAFHFALIDEAAGRTDPFAQINEALRDLETDRVAAILGLDDSENRKVGVVLADRERRAGVPKAQPMEGIEDIFF